MPKRTRTVSTSLAASVSAAPPNNIVCISDLHSGCRLALCPRTGVPLDDGGIYMPSPLQLKMVDMWDEFWDEWVPEATKGEKFDLVINGDAIEGDHHHARTPFSTNPVDQCRCARLLLEPKLEAARKKGKLGRLFMVRGTEAHVGRSASEEEVLGQQLHAVQNKEGQYVRWDLWLKVGDDKLVHFLHHVGTTSSQSYESTAIGKELVEEYNEAARWHRKIPDCVVRSHRHRNYQVTIPTGRGNGIAVVTPAWQAKTAFTWKIAGGRLSTPQFGGILIRYAHDRLFVDSKVWTVDRSEEE